MISQKSVQEILERARIEDIVEDFVNLKRRGVNYIGLCPFHNEKTPSFTVSPSKNICKCFGCGKGGDPVGFLKELEGFNFPEALRYIAKKYGIQIEEKELSQEAIKEKQLFDSLYLVNEYAKDFYQKELFETTRGKSVGLSYFKNRGFREATIKKFGLGFAPNAKDMLTSSAVAAGYNIELLRKLRLTNKYDGDFFRDRVMFTIHNLTGKVIAFAGRTLQKNSKTAKYINSPETEIYVKNKVLYGAYFAKKSIREENECILVEGYTDVISLHQAGIENVVASSGTSLTVGQINLIKRYTPNIKILYDGDAAGIKAALRGLDLVLEQDMNVKVCLLPDGEDPDSYMQKVGLTAFKAYMDKEAKDFILFKTNLLLAEVADDPIKKTELIRDIVQSISKIPDPIKRSMYVKQCAQLMDISEAILVAESNKEIQKVLKKKQQKAFFDRQRQGGNSGKPAPFPSQAPSFAGPLPIGIDGAPFPDSEHGDGSVVPGEAIQPTLGDEFQEKDIIRILISGGTQIFDKEENISVAEYILNNIEDVLDSFDDAVYEQIAKEYNKKRNLPENYFVNHSDEKVKQVATNLLTSPYEYSPGWEERFDHPLQTQKMPDENFTKDSIYALRRFKLKKVIKMCHKNQEKIGELQKKNDLTKLMKLLKKQQKLMAIRNELAAQMNTVVMK
ncbi:MAG: DNA primase [Bacteroidota bacterium]